MSSNSPKVLLLISWYDLHISTAETQVILRDAYLCTLVIFVYLAMYLRQHLFNSLGPLPSLAVHSSTMESCVLAKVSTFHSPLILWLPLQGPHLCNMLEKALRMSAATTCVRFPAYKCLFGFYSHPVWETSSLFWLHKKLRFIKTDNSLRVTHQIWDR